MLCVTLDMTLCMLLKCGLEIMYKIKKFLTLGHFDITQTLKGWMPPKLKSSTIIVLDFDWLIRNHGTIKSIVGVKVFCIILFTGSYIYHLIYCAWIAYILRKKCNY